MTLCVNEVLRRYLQSGEKLRAEIAAANDSSESPPVN